MRLPPSLWQNYGLRYLSLKTPFASLGGGSDCNLTENCLFFFVFLSLSCTCRLLIQAGYDVNIKDYDGWTPLHAAAHWGKEEACRVLVENLCDMDLINKMVIIHNSHELWQQAERNP